MTDNSFLEEAASAMSYTAAKATDAVLVLLRDHAADSEAIETAMAS